MELGQLAKDRPERIFIAVRNAESSADISQGAPVCFVMNATNDGNDVVTGTTGGATKATSLFAGVVTSIDGIANGRYGVAQVFGLCMKATLQQRTRAATTDSWASVASVAVGAICRIDTVNNQFVTTAAGAASDFLPFAMIAASQASIASRASSTSDTLTVESLKTQIFLRAM